MAAQDNGIERLEARLGCRAPCRLVDSTNPCLDQEPRSSEGLHSITRHKPREQELKVAAGCTSDRHRTTSI